MTFPVPAADALVAWYGRTARDLPWRRTRDPYAILVSEIMLQQTRVETVRGYFERFMQRFPNVASLAAADIDEVLGLWSGLGYYARARNLHRTARLLCKDYACEFPRDFAAIAQLPGIGRSTAGAIMALSFGERHAILDGNVKRVLARFHEVDGWPGTPSAASRLWALAEAHTPQARVAHYTQAMMDLGAAVCTRSRPRCDACPLMPDCGARRSQRTAQLPAPKPRRELPVRKSKFLVLCNEQGAVLLERRPPSGIWGGLWSLPECPPEQDIAAWCGAVFGCRIADLHTGSSVRHTFTHFHLDLVPVFAQVSNCAGALMEGGNHVWYNTAQPVRLGLAAPVKRLLQALKNASEGASA